MTFYNTWLTQVDYLHELSDHKMELNCRIHRPWYSACSLHKIFSDCEGRNPLHTHTDEKESSLKCLHHISPTI